MVARSYLCSGQIVFKQIFVAIHHSALTNSLSVCSHRHFVVKLNDILTVLSFKQWTTLHRLVEVGIGTDRLTESHGLSLRHSEHRTTESHIQTHSHTEPHSGAKAHTYVHTHLLRQSFKILLLKLKQLRISIHLLQVGLLLLQKLLLALKERMKNRFG